MLMQNGAASEQGLQFTVHTYIMYNRIEATVFRRRGNLAFGKTFLCLPYNVVVSCRQENTTQFWSNTNWHKRKIENRKLKQRILAVHNLKLHEGFLRNLNLKIGQKMGTLVATENNSLNVRNLMRWDQLFGDTYIQCIMHKHTFTLFTKNRTWIFLVYESSQPLSVFASSLRGELPVKNAIKLGNKAGCLSHEVRTQYMTKFSATFAPRDNTR